MAGPPDEVSIAARKISHWPGQFLVDREEFKSGCLSIAVKAMSFFEGKPK
jgi:hypothetical protein